MDSIRLDPEMLWQTACRNFRGFGRTTPKHLFSDKPTAATETLPVTMPKTLSPWSIIRKPQINGFPPRLVGYMRVSSACGASPRRSCKHTTYKAFAEAELNPYGRFDLDMNSRLAL
jgi:hypothetical protein